MIPRQSEVSAVESFIYDDATRAALRSALSADRFATYLRLARGREVRAQQLYARNAALASAMHGPLHMLEVTLRNAAHDSLSETHGTDWLSGVALTTRQRKMIDSATRGLRQQGKEVTSSGLVAEMSFGFWVALFAKRFDQQLWRVALHRAFEPTPARSELHRQLEQLRALRNRIAHHEPILKRDLNGDYEALLEVLAMLSPEVSNWVRHYSRVPEVLTTSTSRIMRF